MGSGVKGHVARDFSGVLSGKGSKVWCHWMFLVKIRRSLKKIFFFLECSETVHRLSLEIFFLGRTLVFILGVLVH